jgi:hypothetical protein
MTSADHYRALANEIEVKAAFAGNPSMSIEFEQLARSYVRLADLADKNAVLDVGVEFTVSSSSKDESA